MDEIDKAARRLVEARRKRQVIAGLPEELRPRSLTEAYAVQDKVFDLLGEASAGWFLGCTNPAIQSLLGLPHPYRSRLRSSTLYGSPARLDPAAFPVISLEVEFAFTLGRDLPPEGAPYGAEAVAAVVAALHPSIEMVTSNLSDWTEQPVYDLIADNGTDGALVLGAGREDWRTLDLASLATELEVDGAVVRQGRGDRVMGSPLAALTWLANDLARIGEGLRAGQVVNTGSSTEIYHAAPGDRGLARFEGLGEVEVRFETSS